MGLDMWFTDDIRNILLGVELASAHLASRCNDPEMRAYREGFNAALAAIGTSFGISPGEIVLEVRARPRTALPPAEQSL